MRIRLARRSDIPALASIASAAFLHEPIYDHLSPLRFQYPDHYHAFWVNIWRGKLASAGNAVFVAQTDASDEGEGEGGNRGEVVGFSTWYRTGSAEELLRWNTDSWPKRMGAQLHTQLDLLISKLNSCHRSRTSPPRNSAALYLFLLFRPYDMSRSYRRCALSMRCLGYPIPQHDPS